MPGEARAVGIALTPRTGGAGPRTVPAWVIVGTKPGPRVSVVGAIRGGDATPARAAVTLAAEIDPAALTGSVVIVPVVRPLGRLARRGHRDRAAPVWRFPGDAAGPRAPRDAFLLFSDIVVGAQALVVLSVPPRGRRGILTARGILEDPRVRRLAMGCGASALLAAPPAAGGLLAAAAGAGVPAIELTHEGVEGPAGESDAAAVLVGAARAALTTLGLLARTGGDGASPARELREPRDEDAVVNTRTVRVRAPADGFLEAPIAPGTAVRARATLGRVVPFLPGAPALIRSEVAGLVLEAAPPGPVRAGGTLFVLAPGAGGPARGRGGAPSEPARSDGAGKIRVGWVEQVGLPGLGIERLKAKIDTGARTSALHVARMRTVGTGAGLQRRPILAITVPGGGRGRRPHVVRAAVREFVVVRDSSGRTERRPVIETVLRLGTVERRIAVTLTNRGDMLFPMLIGRTALGPGVIVDPSRRYLLGSGRSAGKKF
jgi:predicted deacylase